VVRNRAFLENLKKEIFKCYAKTVANSGLWITGKNATNATKTCRNCFRLFVKFWSTF